MYSAESLSKYQEAKAALLQLMEELKKNQTEQYGLTLLIIDKLTSIGGGIYLDENGQWSGRLDMMGWTITSDELSMDPLVTSVANLIDPNAPIDDGINDRKTLHEQRKYLQQNGDRILGILVNAMNSALQTYKK